MQSLTRVFIALALWVALPAAAAPVLGGCPVFPRDNVWNTRIDALPVAANSATLIASIGASGHIHPDFGSNPDYGLPYALVPQGQTRYPVLFDYADESDPGPYPVPLDVPIEAGGDAHILVIEQGVCGLYEMWDASRNGAGWRAGSGAYFDLISNALRPDGWTSSDAAGLPVLAGLVRYNEVAAGQIQHALRFTVSQTRAMHIWPARHDASSNNSASLPPMGLRLRLRADYPEAGLSSTARVIIQALKHYGMILADNGSNWYITGATDTRWNDTALNELKAIRGDDFEVVDESALMVDPDSGEARIFSASFER